MSPLETIIWDQDKVLSPLLRGGLASPPWEALLICPPESRAAELAPAEGMTGYTEPEPTASPSTGS